MANKNGKRPGIDKPTLPEVEQYLAGLDFPATKRDVLEYAAAGKAPQDVLDELAMLREKLYGGPAELSKDVADILKITP